MKCLMVQSAGFMVVIAISKVIADNFASGWVGGCIGSLFCFGYMYWFKEEEE